ncbi:MAG: NADH:flavin oxidoreductase/NADH oxidase family protein [Pseudomonadota bacterium]
MIDLFQPVQLPCGVQLKNRMAKSAMSDSLGDGRGNPTDAQIRLYERWAQGGAALSIVGEVQGNPNAAEKPGNLVLGPKSDDAQLRALTTRGSANHTHLWAQLGHAGAMAHPPLAAPDPPRGPSALELPGQQIVAMSLAEVQAIPDQIARTAAFAKRVGFTGVEVHAAHGFLLSQFLSPLFNQRADAYGGDVKNRMRLVLETIDAVRAAVGESFPMGLKLNATDQLEGGFVEDEALEVVKALDATDLDLIDISGDTYFPGAKSASDAASSGPYFLDFTRRARTVSSKPLMSTGGFKTFAMARDAVASGAVDMVGLARPMVLDPSLPDHWQSGQNTEPTFPRFADPQEGAVTAWYTMRLTQLAEDAESQEKYGSTDANSALATYNARDNEKTKLWQAWFSSGPRHVDD